jgi:peptide/nickel transport system substrate-binding protein
MKHTRRQFLQLSALATTGVVLAACQPAAAPTAVAPKATEAPAAPKATEAKAAAAPTTAPAAQTGAIKDVAREKCFVITGWSDTGSVLPGFDNWNTFMNAGAALRTKGGNLGMSEGLFYRNLNDGKETPWLAESYKANADFTQWTINLRKGVEWSDGVPFTSKDVKFTIETCINNAPDLIQSSYLKEWTKEVTCPDDFTVVITLNKPSSRYIYPLVIGWEYHFAIVPEHIWKDQDPKTFTNFDLAKGWPVFTGPYKLVAASGTQVFLDRRDDWWAVKTGFVKQMPAPERIIVLPGATDDVMAARYITNQIDYGGPLLIGTYRTAVTQNPKLRPWFPPDSKILGAPDGCLYQLMLNCMKPPFDDKNVRLAANYAMNRQQLVDLAYLGSTYTRVVPFSAYIENWSTGDLKKTIDSFDRGTPNQTKVEEYMKAAGYAKNASGMWEKGGATCKFTVRTPNWLAPIGPVVTEQLTAAGFDVTESPDRTDAWSTELGLGQTDACVMVFCGSNFEPYDTLKALHSKLGKPIGTAAEQSYRYVNPEYDAVIDKLELMLPNINDPAYTALVTQATKIFLEDMPTLVLAEELHVIPGNQTYWTGFPNGDDPYVAPFPCWRDIFLMTLKLKSA